MSRNLELGAAAAMVDLRDKDLLQLAKADLPPKEAVRDLMRRFPGAFGDPQNKHVSQMTEVEEQDFCRKNNVPYRRRQAVMR